MRLRAPRSSLAVRHWSAGAARRPLPSFDDVRAAHRPSRRSAARPPRRAAADAAHRRPRAPPALGDAGRHLAGAARAIVLSEDRRFWEHGGVDWRAVAASAWANAWNTRTRGASTLTMQLAGLLDDDLARPAGGRSVAQKLGQAIAAHAARARLDARAQILEAYLNRCRCAASWSASARGADAVRQARQRAGRRRGRARRGAGARAERRARRGGAPRLRAAAAAAARAAPAWTALVAARRWRAAAGMPLGEQLAPHFARQRARRARPGGAAQHARRRAAARGDRRAAPPARRAARPQRRGRRRRRARQRQRRGAGLGRLPRRQRRRPRRSTPCWRGASPARRSSPSSTRWRCEHRLITPASLLDDSPLQLATGAGLYLPQNYDRDFKGWVSVRRRWRSSLNVPAVRVRRDARAGRAVRAARRRSACALRESRRLPRPCAGAGQRRRDAARPHQRLPHAGQRRRCAARRALRRPRTAAQRRVADAAAALHRGRHPGRRGARALHLRPGQPARHARLRGGEDRHQQGHARQLVHRLHRPLHGRRVGRQCQRRADARRQRRQRRGAGVARAGRRICTRPAVACAGAPAGVVRRSESCSTVQPKRRARSCSSPAPSRSMAAAQRAAAPRAASASPTRATAACFALDPDIPPRAQQIVFEGEAGTWVLDGRRLGRGDVVPGCRGRAGMG